MRKGMFFHRGFTLTEITIAIAILGVIAVISIPGFRSWMSHYRLKSTVSDLVSMMQFARASAVTEGRQYRVRINIDANTFWLERGNLAEGSTNWVNNNEGGVMGVSPRVDIVWVYIYWSGTRNIVFNPDGTSSSGPILLNNSSNERYRITLASATGRIKVWKGWW